MPSREGLQEEVRDLRAELKTADAAARDAEYQAELAEEAAEEAGYKALAAMQWEDKIRARLRRKEQELEELNQRISEYQAEAARRARRRASACLAEAREAVYKYLLGAPVDGAGRYSYAASLCRRFGTATILEAVASIQREVPENYEYPDLTYLQAVARVRNAEEQS